MSRFTTVLWDTGGVLLTNGWDHLERKAVFDAVELEDREGFEQRHAVENDAWEKGLIGFDEYLRRTVFYRPRPFSCAMLRQKIEEQSRLLDDSAMPVLTDLHARGTLTLGQLNNESRELNDYRLDQFGLNRIFSVFFCSAYVALRKPDPAIFQLALEVLQRPAADVIFIDDREKNVAAACGVGMHGIMYRGASALREELTGLGLLEPRENATR